MTLYYKEYGHKHAPLMVFIHGGGVSGWMWNKQIEYFKHFHCLVPDLPEQGLSNGDCPFSINTSAEKIISLIEEKGQRKTIIAIGFSLGAQVLIAILSKRPDLIQYAMINSALVKPISYAKMFTKSLVVIYPLTRNKTFSKIQAKSMYIDTDLYETYYNESGRMSKNTFTRIMNENMSFTIPKSFDRANGNILVTVGEKEKKMMKDSMIEIINSNPKCRGFVFPKMGHGVSLAEPELFNHVVEKWIQQDALPLSPTDFIHPS
ncbi:alpha/beta hydrolase [Paenibacillus sp. SC116]|uniref:alpha/beta fold hydrolase n=1 Tax=Paenibacillus sp. SC116 TaxID=2968986 RepID=UPI00215A2D26|nr:alpha/beta hydrolase [Paenibacillus sp. SC116]MCR8844755.1 alpha/beta hydrolase [Paenibacillus sp. SC116]